MLTSFQAAVPAPQRRQALEPVRVARWVPPPSRDVERLLLVAQLVVLETRLLVLVASRADRAPLLRPAALGARLRFALVVGAPLSLDRLRTLGLLGPVCQVEAEVARGAPGGVGTVAGREVQLPRVAPVRGLP